MAASELEIVVKEEAANSMAETMIYVASRGNPERAEILYDGFYEFVVMFSNINCYSYFIASTGFILAACNACQLTVITVIMMDKTKLIIKT